MPTLTGWNFATSPSSPGMKTPFLPSRSTTALAGTTSALCLVLDGEADLRVHARLQAELRVVDLDLDLRRARRRIEHRRDARDAAGELSRPGTHRLRRPPACPAVMRRRSFSTTLATSRTTPMSTTEMNDEFGVTHAPGSSMRLPTKPLTGDVMIGVGEVDLQLVEPRLRLRVLRLGEIELGHRRLVARLGVVEASASGSAGARTGCASDRGSSARA